MYNPGQEFQKFATQHMGMSSLGVYDYVSSVNHQIWAMTPNVIEERSMNIAIMDVFSRLMMDRIIFLGHGIDDYISNIVNAQLLFLDSADSTKDVYIYINSPGGSVYAGLGIYDVMQYITPDVSTVCTGMAASMAAVLLCAGAAGKRVGLPHSRVMIHQPLGGAQGQASDMEIAIEQIKKVKKELYSIEALHSGQTVERIEKDSDRDYWMTAEEAKAYGLIDEVLSAGNRKKNV
jgi:ATP-dependent Clp protease, protease subunit